MKLEDSLTKWAFNFIANNDEYAKVIPDGKIDETSRLMAAFAEELMESIKIPELISRLETINSEHHKKQFEEKEKNNLADHYLYLGKCSGVGECLDLISEMTGSRIKICPKCNNPFPHLYKDKGGHCEECDHEWDH